MKTIRPYFLCAVALVAFSCATAWLFQQWRLSDRPKFVPPAAAEAPTPEQQKVKQYLQQTQEIGHLEEELRRATLSETKNTVNELRKKIDASKTLRANSFGSVDFTPADLPKRIPAGATDPDSVWKGQMQNARDTLRSQGIPTRR